MSIKWYTHNWESLNKKALYEVLELRSAVFVVEQDCVYQDIDSKDQKATHILGYEKLILVAYSRILVNTNYATIGRVVIHPSFRGLGHGRLLIKKSLSQLPTKTTTHISAQEHLKTFYESLGFLQTGKGYLEDGIPHIPMTNSANQSTY